MAGKREKILLAILIVILLFTGLSLPLYLVINSGIIDLGIIGSIIDEGWINNAANSNVKEQKIVTKIIDGDTVIVEGGESVRLLGIDCDERGKECYTPAKKRIDELLLGKIVELEKEKEDRDQYDRQLRWIFLDGKNINAQMVEEGYCVARFYGESKYKEEIQKAEREAIMGEIGCKWENS